jgi:subtilisin family serine protease/subtilase family serine protease
VSHSAGGGLRQVCTPLRVLAVGAAILFFSSPVGTQGNRLGVDKINDREVAAGEILIKLRDTATPSQLTELAAGVDSEDLQRVGNTGFLRLRSRSVGAGALLARLAKDPAVEIAEPNYIVYALSEPTDPGFPSLWGLKNTGQPVNLSPAGTPGADISAVDAWATSVGSTTHVVAVIDTGIDYTHPDLAANMWSAPTGFTVNIGGVPITCPAGSHGFNVLTKTCDPMDDRDHGTHVSGTIGAVGGNAEGVVGVNWTTRLMGLKFLNAAGSGTVADAITAIEFAVQVKQVFAGTGGADIRVLSNSWGGFETSTALRTAISLAKDNDMLFVAAAGNSGISNELLPTYPASYDLDNIIAVAATTNADKRASFSNYGAISVDLGAPGVDILSTLPGGNYGFMSGTSMATPHVSGAAMLVLSECNLDTAQLRDAVLHSVDPIAALATTTTTGGRLNVHSALLTCTAPPETPTGLTARGGDAKVTLLWPNVPGAIDYTVKRSLSQSGPFAVVATGVKGTTYIDTGVQNGTAYYYVLSARNFRGESGDSNIASVTPAIPGDLIVTAVTAPATTAAGATISVAVSTKNQGAGVAPTSKTLLYLSPNTSYSTTDTLLGSRDVPALASGTVDSASLSVTIPPDTVTGSYYVVAIADLADQIVESSETNNTKASAVVKIGPDLFVSALTAPPSAVPGGTITVSDTTKNQGAASAGASTTQFYLSTNTVFGSTDVLLGSRNVPLLVSGASDAVSATVLTVPPNTAAGSYYVIALADGVGVIGETSESNNDKASAVIRIGADLLVTSVTAPGTAVVGGTISVTETTSNKGTTQAPESSTGYYLSTNTLFGSTDTLIGNRSIGQLDPNDVSTATITLQIPPGTQAGSYYIVAVSDYPDAIVESIESNNDKASAVIRIGADLLVTSITVPASAAVGATISITETTKNQGTTQAPESATGYYLSTNTLFGSTDTLIGSRSIGKLDPNGVSTATTTLQIPPGTQAGLYYIIGVSDWPNAIVESIESNNDKYSAGIRVGGDLDVTSFSIPATGTPGGQMSVTDTTLNAGAGPIPESSTGFYLSANSLFGPSDILIGSRTVRALDPGIGDPATTVLTIPPDTVPATYYVFAIADWGDAIYEANESNNEFRASTTIRIGPDLTVTSVTTAPTSAPLGSSVTASATISNQGGTATPLSTTNFYMSSNSTYDTTDVLIGSASSAVLQPGASVAVSATVTIPTTTATGTRYIIAKTDGDDAIAEASETNNTKAKSISITP